MDSKPFQQSLTILRRPQVQQRTGLSCSSIYALMSSGDFPAPIRMSPHTVGWLEHEIDRWIAERAQASRKSK